MLIKFGMNMVVVYMLDGVYPVLKLLCRFLFGNFEVLKKKEHSKKRQVHKIKMKNIHPC